jgi:hypothetical protein
VPLTFRESGWIRLDHGRHWQPDFKLLIRRRAENQFLPQRRFLGNDQRIAFALDVRRCGSFLVLFTITACCDSSDTLNASMNM